MHIAIASIFVTLGISEIVTGIWSAVCCCRSCCAVTPSEPVSRPLETFLKNDHSCIHSCFVTPPVGLEAVKTSFEAALSFSQSSKLPKLPKLPKQGGLLFDVFYGRRVGGGNFVHGKFDCSLCPDELFLFLPALL